MPRALGTVACFGMLGVTSFGLCLTLAFVLRRLVEGRRKAEPKEVERESVAVE